MKKILFAAMAALAITSCSQNEEIEAPAKKAEIKFQSIVKTAPRVASMATDNFTDFHIYGYNIGNNAMTTTTNISTPLISNGSAYHRDDNTKPWEGDIYYWPATATDKVCFFAYSPTTSDITYTAATGYPTLGYTIKAVANQVDLVAAKQENLLKNSNAVTLDFNHILTQINFSAKLEAKFTYTISKIEITGVAETGTYDYGTGEWSGQTGTQSYIYAGHYETAGYTPTAVGTGDEVSFSTNPLDNALMLLPQTFSADSNAKISITYNVKASTGQETFNGTKEVELKNTTAWGEGKNIRYTLTLPTGAEAITLTPQVGQWTDDPRTPQL